MRDLQVQPMGKKSLDELPAWLIEEVVAIKKEYKHTKQVLLFFAIVLASENGEVPGGEPTEQELLAFASIHFKYLKERVKSVLIRIFLSDTAVRDREIRQLDKIDRILKIGDYSTKKTFN